MKIDSLASMISPFLYSIPSVIFLQSHYLMPPGEADRKSSHFSLVPGDRVMVCRCRWQHWGPAWEPSHCTASLLTPRPFLQNDYRLCFLFGWLACWMLLLSRVFVTSQVHPGKCRKITLNRPHYFHSTSSSLFKHSSCRTMVYNLSNWKRVVK